MLNIIIMMYNLYVKQIALPQEYFNQLACINKYEDKYAVKYVWHDGCYIYVDGKWISAEQLESGSNWSGNFGP